MIVLIRVFTFALFPVFAFAAPASEPPNIVLILADDLGYGDIGAYGGEIQTPHIDSLARDGARFEAFYVTAPVCTPSRYSLLTGRYPNRSQDQLMLPLMFLEERDRHRGLRSAETTMAERLRHSGYSTALFGKWHLGHGENEFLPQNHGFDHAYGCHGGAVDYFTLMYGRKPDWFRNGKSLVEDGYATDLITDEALRWLQRQRGDRPFFIFLSYTAPHFGKGWDDSAQKPTNALQAKPSDRERYGHIGASLRREYAGMVASMDDGVGRLLAALREAGLEENTLVVFTSDNGGIAEYGGSNSPLRGGKDYLFEGGIREPCLMRWPGKIPPGTVVTEPASTLDFFPTFCELGGISPGDGVLDGVSFASWLSGRGTIPARDLFWLTPREAAFRRGPWKYLRNREGETLFNLEQDLAEAHNLAVQEPKMFLELKEAHAAIAAQFSSMP